MDIFFKFKGLWVEYRHKEIYSLYLNKVMKKLAGYLDRYPVVTGSFDPSRLTSG